MSNYLFVLTYYLHKKRQVQSAAVSGRKSWMRVNRLLRQKLR